MHQPIEEVIPDSPWDLWDPPFVHTCRPKNAVKTFVEFLTHADAKLYEIESLSFYSATLKLVGNGGEVYLRLQPARTSREERRRLCEALRQYPTQMPRVLREKLSAVVYLFFDLDRLPKD